MAFQRIEHVRVYGMSACVPANVVENSESPLFATHEDYLRFAETTHIYRRHVATEDVCSSDLCEKSARKLLDDLQWSADEIECLIFVSQTPDYILPATSCILQNRLGCSKNCMAFDISLGCSGWVYGLSVAAALANASRFKKVLLLVGDTVTKTKSPLDKTTYPLFGDAGTATALGFDDTAVAMYFNMNTDGSGADAIIIRDGGFRHPFCEDSLEVHQFEDGGIRNNLQSYLDGGTVFTFGISRAPKCVKTLLEEFDLDGEAVDYYVFHQANMIMNEKIRSKLKLPAEKVPYIMEEYGNTSSTSIPLTIVTRLRDSVVDRSLNIMACGFGVGLSWGAVYFSIDNIVCSELLEY